MLCINNLSFSYPHFTAETIHDVNLTIEPGKVYALLGPNGAGKSTLLYLICGLLTPKSGSVTLNGIDTRLRLPQTLADIYIVPEEFSLPAISLSEYCKIYSPFYPRFSYDDLHRNLDAFGMGADLNLGLLSMGQKKKALMCFALATNTPLLLMDEPTNGLDITSKANFRAFISQQMTDERSIIISTHQTADVSKLLDHILILNGNSIVLDQSIIAISSRLAFAVTSDPDTIAQALLAKPSVMGTAVALDNRTALADSDVDLELLYELATSRPDVINEIFSDNTPTPPPYEK